MLSSALKLARNGMSVFPCRVRDKRPATANGCTDATRDPAQIRAWWQQDANFNIAIATGDRSGIFVVDIDNEDGANRRLRHDIDVIDNQQPILGSNSAHRHYRSEKRAAGQSLAA
jgi:hypothetical protein